MTTELDRSADRLVGRQRETSTLCQQLEIALGGELRVAVLSGEPGIGKSRLLAQIGQEARAAGAIALYGGASLAEGMPPYLAFLRALTPHLRALDVPRLRSAAGDTAATLAEIFPELAARLGDLPAPPALPPEKGRLRLFDAVGSFLAALGEPGGLVLCLDDLQWADASTLDLLAAIAIQHPSARLLLAGAYREGEAEGNPALLRVNAELTRQRRLITIRLRPLSTEETRDLAAGHLGGPVGATLLGRLHGQSEGNPFFVEELLGGWQDAEALRWVDGRWELASAPVDTLPPSILAAVRQRLARLPAPTVDLLRVGAIVGRTFSLDLLAAVGGDEPEAVEDALQPALHARLIRSDRDGTFTFGHDAIRECLHGEVSATRRRRLHGAIAQALAERTGMRVTPAGPAVRMDAERDSPRSSLASVAELAFHFARSADVERGILYSLQAGECARQAYAYEEALAHYTTAHDLLDPGDDRRPWVLLSIGEVALPGGRADEAAAAFDAARGALRGLDRAAAARATHGLGVTRWRQDRLDEARVALEAALALHGDEERPEKIRVLIDLATVLGVALGRQPESMAHARRALEAARRIRNAGSEHRGLEAIAAATMGKLLMRGNDFTAGIAALEEALVLAEAADDPATAAECCANLSNGYYSQGKVEQSRHYTHLRLEYARRCQQPHEMRHVHGWLALLDIWQGRWAAAEARLAEAQAVVDRLPGDEPLAYLHAMRGCLAYQRARLAEAVDHLERTVAIHRTKGAAHLTWFEGLLMLAYLEAGDRRAALACRDELEAAVRSLPAGIVPTAPALTCLIKLALALDDVERAAGYESGLRPFGGEMFSLFMVDSALAALATAQGSWEAADAYLQRAEGIARANGLHPALADLLALRADLVLRRAGEDAVRQARPLLDEAASLFAGLDMEHRARPLRDRLQHLPQPDRRRRVDLPAGLSRREAEVLRLVAAGKSNREISQALFLSENTVANHLTSIFNKTGAENRAAATAFAIRHGLA